MLKDDGKLFERTLSKNPFLSELYRRTERLPFKSESGNELISIDAKGSSKEFVRKLEVFVDAKSFKLLVRGSDYYLEVLNGTTFHDAIKMLIPK